MFGHVYLCNFFCIFMHMAFLYVWAMSIFSVCIFTLNIINIQTPLCATQALLLLPTDSSYLSQLQSSSYALSRSKGRCSCLGQGCRLVANDDSLQSELRQRTHRLLLQQPRRRQWVVGAHNWRWGLLWWRLSVFLWLFDCLRWRLIKDGFSLFKFVQ